MRVQPVRSSDPKGARILLYDNGHGWMICTFVPRTEDPRINVEESFWQ
ncbi:hypothetical protein ACH4CE_21145 [Streptomyces gelaticus]